jgi:hypothetical protein
MKDTWKLPRILYINGECVSEQTTETTLPKAPMKTRTYKLLCGKHRHEGKSYLPGQTITTTQTLNIMFPDRFEVVGQEVDDNLNLGDKFKLDKVSAQRWNLVSIKTGYPINDTPLKKTEAYALYERLNGNPVPSDT